VALPLRVQLALPQVCVQHQPENKSVDSLKKLAGLFLCL
jgi:hypothetical protein